MSSIVFTRLSHSTFFFLIFHLNIFFLRLIAHSLSSTFLSSSTFPCSFILSSNHFSFLLLYHFPAHHFSLSFFSCHRSSLHLSIFLPSFSISSFSHHHFPLPPSLYFSLPIFPLNLVSSCLHLSISKSFLSLLFLLPSIPPAFSPSFIPPFISLSFSPSYLSHSFLPPSTTVSLSQSSLPHHHSILISISLSFFPFSLRPGPPPAPPPLHAGPLPRAGLGRGTRSPSGAPPASLSFLSPFFIPSSISLSCCPSSVSHIRSSLPPSLYLSLHLLSLTNSRTSVSLYFSLFSPLTIVPSSLHLSIFLSSSLSNHRSLPPFLHLHSHHCSSLHQSSFTYIADILTRVPLCVFLLVWLFLWLFYFCGFFKSLLASIPLCGYYLCVYSCVAFLYHDQI